MQDTTQLIAIILLAAFGIERVVAAAKFALQPVSQEDGSAQKRRELLLFALAASIALAVVDFGGIRIIQRLQSTNTPSGVDYWLTWLVVLAGSNRIHEFLPSTGIVAPKVQAAPAVPPVTFLIEEGKPVQRVAA
ncbi:MAG TPA: hypothetical protein VII75_13025 [Thermoanaerobaculia bacterium]|nr:hypothetical protein [Thermoanaerobaculia bacterium]